MDISEVARKSGVSASAQRYDERQGLIRPLTHGGARRLAHARPQERVMKAVERGAPGPCPAVIY